MKYTKLLLIFIIITLSDILVNAEIIYQGDKVYSNYAVGSSSVSATVTLRFIIPESVILERKENFREQSFNIEKEAVKVYVLENNVVNFDQRFTLKTKDGEIADINVTDLSKYLKKGQSINSIISQLPSQQVQILKDSKEDNNILIFSTSFL